MVTFVCKNRKIRCMETMYDTLLQLPLFQGLCHEDFTNILGKVKLHFTTYKIGETIVKPDMVCDRLVFLLKGEISSYSSPKGKYFTFIEHFEAPYVIEAYSLFGMNLNYTSSYVARTEAQTISVSKSFVLTELFNYDIFRLNYMNIISNRAQIFYDRVWRSASETIEEKIIDFILARTEKFTGEKDLKIRMEDIGAYVDGTRLNVSKALNDLQALGLFILSRKAIHIPEISTLVQWSEAQRNSKKKKVENL
jgi:CRP-like cAMP-binding protein